MILEQKINNNLIQIVLAISLGLIVTIIIFSLNRGFDFTDEGGFLLSYKYANTYKGGIYNYHIIIAKLTNWFNPGILAYRWLSLILTLFSSFILSIGLYRWLKTNYSTYCIYKNFVLIFCFLCGIRFARAFLGLAALWPLNGNTLRTICASQSVGRRTEESKLLRVSKRRKKQHEKKHTTSCLVPYLVAASLPLSHTSVPPRFPTRAPGADNHDDP